MKFDEINSDTNEGKFLIASIGALMCQDKFKKMTPGAILDDLQKRVDGFV